MSEHDGEQVDHDHGTAYAEPADAQPEAQHPAVEHPAVERTGHPAVDRVLDSLDGLADLPVADHVAVFESAHDQLRGALANAGEPTTPQPRG
jgi:hypothetical protein